MNRVVVGQGFEFDSSTDYKLHKRLSAFETLSRGTKQYAFNAMKGNIPFSVQLLARASVWLISFGLRMMASKHPSRPSTSPTPNPK